MTWILINPENEKFIKVDYNSGGYPYEVDYPFRATLWNDERDAIRYTAVMSYPNYDNPVYVIREVKLEFEMVDMPTGQDLANYRK